MSQPQRPGHVAATSSSVKPVDKPAQPAGQLRARLPGWFPFIFNSQRHRASPLTASLGWQSQRHTSQVPGHPINICKDPLGLPAERHQEAKPATIIINKLQGSLLCHHLPGASHPREEGARPLGLPIHPLMSHLQSQKWQETRTRARVPGERKAPLSLWPGNLNREPLPLSLTTPPTPLLQPCPLPHVP